MYLLWTQPNEVNYIKQRLAYTVTWVYEAFLAHKIKTLNVYSICVRGRVASVALVFEKSGLKRLFCARCFHDGALLHPDVWMSTIKYNVRDNPTID